MVNILIVEDHHLLVCGYKSMLAVHICDIENIYTVKSCEEAFNVLNTSLIQFDFVFLDWSLPPSEKRNLIHGGDLVPLINQHSPNRKLIILTSHTEALILYQITREASPDALLCKIDFQIDDFKLLLNTILRGDQFYSPTVIEQLKQITLRKEYLDNYNRQIIVLLSRGVKTKSLSKYLPLSTSAIDKRKAQIKDYFLLGKGTDEDILAAARKAGFI